MQDSLWYLVQDCLICAGFAAVLGARLSFVQDSLRYLVQDSLVSFTQMILDAAHSTLELQDDFEWSGNYINSTFRSVYLFNCVL